MAVPIYCANQLMVAKRRQSVAIQIQGAKHCVVKYP